MLAARFCAIYFNHFIMSKIKTNTKKAVSLTSVLTKEHRDFINKTYLSPSGHMKYFIHDELGKKAIRAIVKDRNEKFGTSVTVEQVLGKGNPRHIMEFMSDYRKNSKDGKRKDAISMYFFIQAIGKFIESKKAAKKK
tara:strand:- start:118 stop:528 length:411 start_codon:yes stop_codon:yes gene_type:complete